MYLQQANATEESAGPQTVTEGETETQGTQEEGEREEEGGKEEGEKKEEGGKGGGEERREGEGREGRGDQQVAQGGENEEVR